MNQSIHTIALLSYLMSDVKKVSVFTGLEAHTDIEVEDVCVAMLEFASGAHGGVQAYTACYSEAGHPAQVQICGTQGSAFMVDDKFSVWEFKNKTAGDAEI